MRRVPCGVMIRPRLQVENTVRQQQAAEYRAAVKRQTAEVGRLTAALEAAEARAARAEEAARGARRAAGDDIEKERQRMLAALEARRIDMMKDVGAELAKVQAERAEAEAHARVGGDEGREAGRRRSRPCLSPADGHPSRIETCLPFPEERKPFPKKERKRPKTSQRLTPPRVIRVALPVSALLSGDAEAAADRAGRRAKADRGVFGG